MLMQASRRAGLMVSYPHVITAAKKQGETDAGWGVNLYATSVLVCWW